jgi:gas vesicle protein
MTNDPEQIRREIEYTRRDLSAKVDALNEKVNPSRAMQRKVDHARNSMISIKDKIMGTAEDTASSTADAVNSAASDATERTASAASKATDIVTSIPQAARRQAQGNPLAAGLIAFGAGWLVSSLLPPSRKEQELASQATNAVSQQMQPLAQQLGQTAQGMAQNLQKPAQQAVESVQATASRAASTITDQSRSAAEDIAGRAEQAKNSVGDSARS